MAVVAALVAHAGIPGGVGLAAEVLHRDGVEIRPEGQGGPVRPDAISRVEPAAPIHQLQVGRMASQNVHQPGFGPGLVVGQLRMGVQLVPQLHGKAKNLRIQGSLLPSFMLNDTIPHVRLKVQG